MPIYDYQCAACGSSFEELVRSDTRVACPDCRSTDVERRLSLPAPARSGGRAPDMSCLGPPPDGGCCGGGCQGHQH